MAGVTRTAPTASPDGPFGQGRGIVIDRAGLKVDCTGPIWRMNDLASAGSRIDWARLSGVRDEVRSATADYLVELIRTHAPVYAPTAFGVLSRMMGTDAFPRQVAMPGTTIGFEPFEEIRILRRWTATYLHHYRMWYVWCARRDYPGFDRAVADRLDEVSIGNDPKGRAVLSDDPRDGPLTDLETTALANALRAADELGTLSPMESVAVWLFLALGSNPLNLALLRADDYQPMSDPGTGAVVHRLKVPRIKKRHAKYRTAFKTRKLNPEIGAKVAALVAANEERARRDGWPHGDFAMPLFVRASPRSAVAESDHRAFAMHLDSTEVRTLLVNTVDKLGVISPRTGEPLRVVPRRLRYTFITRFLREGGSLKAAAEAADHSDTQTVITYVNLRGDLVPRLDEALALQMAPMGMAFMGMVVRSEAEAVRGDVGAPSRVYHHARDRGAIEPVGTCGSFAFCGLTAPTACYECVRFQPWLDGPHDEVLRTYVARRQDMMDRGVDEGQVRTMDRTILAVAAVVRQVAEFRQGDAA